MSSNSTSNGHGLTGHALRNYHLRQRALARAATAPPLARTAVQIRADTLGMTRLEFARRSGISRGTLRDFELGVHIPARQTLQQFAAFCQKRGVAPGQLEQLHGLYVGSGSKLEQLIARLEILAGSARELARRAGISPSTLWEYRRGNFPLPLPLLKRLCRAVRSDEAAAEALWHEVERQRRVARGYPEAWAQLCVLCARQGRAESDLLKLGVTTAALRRLRYLELPVWQTVAPAARALCRDKGELQALKSLWEREHREQRARPKEGFGVRLKQLREQRDVTRRELADLFEIGGKKPARTIKHIEEDGWYSARAYPAGLAALVTDDPAVQREMFQLWRQWRGAFHRRRRPEVRVELRLAREFYGFGFSDMERILGYANREYQRIERGLEPLLDSARQRIIEAVHQAGRTRLESLLGRRHRRESQRAAWRRPSSICTLIALLAKREGGLAPLARRLARAGLGGVSIPRLRSIAREETVPTWYEVKQIAHACEVVALADVRRDWTDRFRQRLAQSGAAPVAVALRLLIAEVAPSVRAFSRKLPFNYSVLTRDLQRIDRGDHLEWFHIERILNAADVPTHCQRWEEIRVAWYTSQARLTAERLRSTPNGQAQGSARLNGRAGKRLP